MSARVNVTTLPGNTGKVYTVHSVDIPEGMSDDAVWKVLKGHIESQHSVQTGIYRDTSGIKGHISGVVLTVDLNTLNSSTDKLP